MAQEVIEKPIDDLDGSEVPETVTFGLDGASYEIDLSKKNAAALRRAIEPYGKAARKRRSAGGPRKTAPPATGRTAQRDYDIVQLREWAGGAASTCPPAAAS